VDEEHGLLHTLAPGASQTVDLEIGPVTTEAEVKSIERECGKAEAQVVDDYREFTEKPKKK
jgi:hypothetical protein